MKYIKLSDYAEKHSLHYQTAYRNFKKGLIPGYQDPNTKTIFVNENEINFNNDLFNKVALYARVSSTQNKKNVENQMERLKEYALAKGYQIVYQEIEIASGLNDNRPKLQKLLSKNDYSILIVEHKDRLTRFGFNYINTLMEQTNRKIEIINFVEENKKDLIDDFISIITSFCARIYGQRRTQRKTEKIIEELKKEE